MTEYGDNYDEMASAYAEHDQPTVSGDPHPVSYEEPTVLHQPTAEGQERGGPLDGLPVVPIAIGAGVLALICVVLAVILGPNLVANAGGNCVSLPYEGEGLSITGQSEEATRACPQIIARDVFLQGDAGRAFEGARSRLPALLEMQSPLYVINGEGPVRVEIPLPETGRAEVLDVYAWDSDTREWAFVPSAQAEGSIIATTEATNLAVFETQRITPLVATYYDADHDLTEEASINMLMPGSLALRADGAIEGELLGGWDFNSGYPIVPLVTADADAINSVLADPALTQLHIEDLRGLVTSNGLNGIALNYTGVEDQAAFTAFVEGLAAAFDEENKLLVVWLPNPAQPNPGYDYAALGAAAGAVVIDSGPHPQDYAIDGVAYAALDAVTDLIPRQKVFFKTTSLSAGVTGDDVRLVPYQEALLPLGQTALDGEVEGPITVGTPLTFDLSGPVENFTPDQSTGAYTFEAMVGGGDLTGWLVTANTVRARLDLAAQYHIGGVVVMDMLADGNDPGLLTAVDEFRRNSASSVPSQILLEWQVTGADGEVADGVTGIGTPFIWQPDAEGDYEVNAAVVGSSSVDRGSVAVSVGEVAEVTEEPETTPAPQTNTNTDAPTATPEVVETPPPSTGNSGADGGGFELGGQVPNAMVHIGEMQSAGMNWVKFQIKWTPGMDPGIAGVFVDAGRSNGFKVLLSIPGPLFPQSIDFAAYTEFLRQVAAYQPDAIEVWNEMNLNREWPPGQIDPTSYVNNMLAPGFNAIKSVSPNTMVIIGALAPTGADDGVNVWSDQRYVQGLAAAGAANYANCIGVHHNSGTTSPYVTSGRPEGNHYSWYYQPTLEVYYFGLGGALPVCVTELGYLSPEGYGELPANFAWAAQNTTAQHAQWLGEAATLSRNLGWVRMMIVFNVGFTTWTADDPQAGFSIVRPDGSCPACAALAGS